MKSALLISSFLFILWYNKLFAQDALLQNTWIGTHLTMHIDSGSARLRDDRDNHFYYRYRVTGSSLLLDDSAVYRSATRKVKPEKYLFEIISIKSDTLILKFVSADLRNWNNHRDTMQLVSAAALKHEGIKFEKLAFATGGCYGTCPSMQIDLEASGNMFFMGRMYTGDYRGMYHGHLSHREMKRLNAILQNCCLDSIQVNTGIITMTSDGPDYLLALYHNQRKDIYVDFNLPCNYPLRDFLRACYKNAGLKKYDGEHKFER